MGIILKEKNAMYLSMYLYTRSQVYIIVGNGRYSEARHSPTSVVY